MKDEKILSKEELMEITGGSAFLSSISAAQEAFSRIPAMQPPYSIPPVEEETRL